MAFVLLLLVHPIFADTSPAPARFATLTVNSTGDESDGDPSDGVCDTGNSDDGLTGLCTLRAAIMQANALGGPNTILFDLGGPFPKITTTGLPAITESIIIDGNTGGADKVVLTIDPGDVTPGVGSGLLIEAGGSSISNLIIYGFGGSGITMTTGEDNVLTDSWLGVDETGASRPNGSFALFMESGGHEIGCPDDPACGNVIDDIGIFFSGGITIQNNFVGTTPDGLSSLDSKGGISLLGSSSNTIVNNLISGGNNHGILLSGGSSSNLIENNAIGIALDEVTPLPNRGDGIHLEGSFSNTIRLNVIAANGTGDPGYCPSIGGCDGIDLRSGSGSNTVSQNFIGTDLTGVLPLGNENNGIFVSDSPDNTIGGSFEEGNTVVDNKMNGVYVEGDSDNNVIAGNLIGVDQTGASPMGNGGYGVVFNGTPANTLGGEEDVVPGMCEGPCNTISANGLGGVFIDEGSSGILVAGNLIGTDVGGTTPLPNDGHGVFVRNASDNQVGPYNSIAFNEGDGIRVVESVEAPSDRNRITQNSIRDNDGIGIDLGGEGVTKNVTVLSDAPNDRMLYPVIITADQVGDAGSSVSGFFKDKARPNESIDIELFDNDSPDPSGHGEGGEPVGSLTVTTNDTGYVKFELLVDDVVSLVSATATDNEGNTSEFSSIQQGITVTQLSDEPDADLGDGQCDTDLEAAGNQCTLRAAIQTANNHPNIPVAGETPIPINFSIEGGCSSCVIQPEDDLPAITQPVIVDGTTQEGASCDAWPPILPVILDGQNTLTAGLDLSDGSDASTVRGLVVQRVAGPGIRIESPDNTVTCNFLGTHAAGTSGEAAGSPTGNTNGIELFSAGNTIGGAGSATDRNLISGNLEYGVKIGEWGAGTETNRIVGNLIGTASDGRTVDPDGTPGTNDDLGNGRGGIIVFNMSPPLAIGGITDTPGAGAGNVISGNGFKALADDLLEGHGIHVAAQIGENNPLTIRGNRIGAAEPASPVDTVAAGNAKDGIFLRGTDNVVVGGSFSDLAPAGANMIAFNGTAGVRVVDGPNSSDNNSIRGNAIFENGFGIGLGAGFVTPNDANDQDTGPNTLFNFPVLGTMTRAQEGDDLTIPFTHQSNDGRNITDVVLDFYENQVCDASGNGQGGRWVGSIRLAPSSGLIDSEIALSGIGKCRPLTVTATDNLGNTSEFSSCQVISNECLEFELAELAHQYPGSEGFEPTTETTDGNPNRIVSRIRNNATQDLKATVSITDGASNRSLIPAEEQAQLRTFPKDAAVDLEFDWDTRGYAWPGGSSPGQVDVTITLRDESGALISEYETPHTVRPRPIVFLHDSWGSPEDWDPYQNFFLDQRDDWTFSTPSFNLGKAPNIADGPFSLSAAHTPTTIETHQKMLDATIEDLRETSKASHVDLIAHGAGGVIGRYYISNAMSVEDNRPIVTNFAMIGVPHHGSQCAQDFFTITTLPANTVIGYVTKGLTNNPITQTLLDNIIGDGYEELHRLSGQNIYFSTPDFARMRLNKEAAEQKNVRFWRFAGRAWAYTCSNITEDGDGAVEFSSQRGSETGFTFQNEGTLAFWNHTTELTSELVGGQVRLAMQSTPDDFAGSEGASQVLDLNSAPDALAEEEPAYIGGGLLPVLSTSPTQFEIPIDQATAFGVTLAGHDVVSRLVDPSGNQVDSLLGQANTALFRGHRVTAPVSGTYTLELNHNVSAGTAVVPFVVWAYGLDRGLDLTVQNPDVTLSLPIQAAFVEAGEPVTGAEVTATLVPLDSSNAAAGETAVTLLDDGLHNDGAAGDGIYGGASTPLIAGRYTLRAWAIDETGSVTQSTLVDLAGYSNGTTVDLEASLEGPATVASQNPVTFMATVVNEGPAGATQARAVIDIGSSFTPTQAQSPTASCLINANSVSCTDATLAAGDTIAIEITADVTSIAANTSSSSMTASSAETDWNLTNNTDETTATFQVGPVSTEEPGDTPAEFALHPSYPNPFNPTTTLSYDVKEATHVRLEVYNLLGQVVETLVDDMQPAGTYRVAFDASQLASGTYLYRITMGEFMDTKTMTLLQ